MKNVFGKVQLNITNNNILENGFTYSEDSMKSKTSFSTNSEETENFNFDIILSEIGNFGKQQRKLIILVYLITIPAGYICKINFIFGSFIFTHILREKVQYILTFI